ncbi:carbohydrate ABC transporter permease [Verminephrobacter eiseniae]|uniref:carbohydrate ABC transporter permease n=1 Tax=Verminephrobacter eiseniae TaxID=364317 RepID=UPI00223848B6|nr:sugar ABC transporter permease [Verminephrobacter eiseniae]MCW5229826.1 sugar ABC transporter permease [Verminephrobacter eiseniae]MCW5263571.1 sugar ABC transporter permease [Verminephrobacter eiseniae]MCW5291557.1 sugar ABC transporter permease [Verminephrobacter eiseniae]MCW8186166.1 sugar ABC transporter permease [Verminephrobacter eiseniae]MCW8222888.1 sugar ABC transporter permease [Verminephrobacter eiseniae]
MTATTRLALPQRPRQRLRFQTLLPYLLSLPALLVCIGILIPFFVAVGYSLQRYNLSFPDQREYIWFDNYIDLLTDGAFWNTVRVSLVYMLATVGVQLLLGMGIALLLKERNRVNNALSVLLILPLMVAPAIASLMWKLMTNPGFGVLNYLLGLLGIRDFGWSSHPDTAMFTVVLVDTWVYTPFIVVLLLAGLRALPPQPFEAAQLDGVPASFVFFRITLPMLTPYILTAGMFRMLDSMQQFDIIYSMTQGGPGDALTVFQVQAYLEAFSFSNIGKSAALVLILWVITYALSTLFIRHWLKLRQRARGGQV